MHEALIQLVGQTVGAGRYRLDGALGQGGMGAVFAGTEVASGRPVAIKLMHPGLGEEGRHLARFRREAEVTARLAHPHVVEVLATGGGEGEPPFIVMELLEGGSIQERSKRGERFDAARTVRIARQVLAAVGAAHEIGVVHRDLKPANVIVTDGPDGEIAKVVDFGVARLAMTDAMTRLTATGQVVGTPSYMAPEQAMGVPADARADVYAVGAIMHRLLAGEPPYGRGPYAEILMRMAADERTRIHARVPGLGRLADVVERALAGEPEGRYPNAEEMDRALRPLDGNAATTVLDWKPPGDLASLRLPPEPEDLAGGIVSAPRQRPSTPTPSVPVRPQPSGALAAPHPERSKARTARNVALVLAALSLGAVATWLVFPRTPAPSADAPASVPETLAVAPVFVGEVDAGADDIAAEGRDAAADAQDEPVARRRRRIVRRTVFVRTTSSEGRPPNPQNAHNLKRQIQARIDFTPCWPAADPLPSFNRGVTFEIEADASGTVAAVRVRGHDNYPEFSRCAMARIRALPALPDADIEGRSLIGVFLDDR